MSDNIKIDTTAGGYYLGASRGGDTVSILLDKNDANGNKVDYIHIKMTPSNAKEIARYLNEYADSIIDSGAL